MRITERELVIEKTRYLEFIDLMTQVLGVTTDVALVPAWHWLFTHETPLGTPLGEDGHPKERPSGVPEDFVQRLWLGSQMEFSDVPIEIGQSLRLQTKVGEATIKQGRSGKLAFVPVELSVSDGDTVLVSERRTGVYLPAPDETAKDETAKDDTAKKNKERKEENILPVLKSISFGEVDLFRYSSILKVFHRIHYDTVFATETEGHPGLLVHGPLLGQALIYQALSMYSGFSPRQVVIKASRPNYVNRPIFLCVEHDETKKLIKVVALDEQQRPAMVIELAE